MYLTNLGIQFTFKSLESNHYFEHQILLENIEYDNVDHWIDFIMYFHAQSDNKMWMLH